MNYDFTKTKFDYYMARLEEAKTEQEKQAAIEVLDMFLSLLTFNKNHIYSEYE